MYTTIYVYDFPSPSSKLSSRSLRVGNKELLYTTQLQTALYKGRGSAPTAWERFSSNLN